MIGLTAGVRQQVVRRWEVGVAEWRTFDPWVKALLAGFLLMTALPRASSYTPGALGYGLVVVLLLLALVAIPSPRVRRSPMGSLPELLALGLGAWCLVSVSWGEGDRVLEALVAALAVLAAYVPWRALRAVEPGARPQFLGWLCAAGTVGSLIAAFPVTWTAHPRPFVLRPGLPMGGASNSAVGLLLLAGGLLMLARVDPACRRLWWALALVDVVLIFQSYSRVAWAMLIAAVVILLVRRPRRRWWAATAVCAVVPAAAILQVRLRGAKAFGPGVRTESALAAVQGWGESPVSLVVGMGSGGMWRWIEEEVRWRSHDLPETLLRDRPWGEVLYHAHSTYLALAVERGLLGLVLFVGLLGSVVLASWRAVSRRSVLFAPAVVLLLSVPAMIFELYLLRGFPSAVLWWTAAWVLMGVDQREGLS